MRTLGINPLYPITFLVYSAYFKLQFKCRVLLKYELEGQKYKYTVI